MPEDDKSVHVEILIRDAKNKNKGTLRFFSIKSAWLSQYLMDVNSELKSKI